MAINIDKYVDITSGIGAGAVATTRSLVGRLFTDSVKLAPGTYLSFSTAAAVGAFFGTTSEEYYRSIFYFAWVSKNLTSPQSIQFARWADVATANYLFSGSGNNSVLANWTSITNGDFYMTIDSTQYHFQSMNFTGAGSLAAVATIISNLITAQTGGQWTGSTLTAVNGGFNFVSGTTGASTILIQAGTTHDITGSGLLGWLPQAINDGQGNLVPPTGGIWVNGSAAETITDCLQHSSDASNNFGSFLFLNNLQLTLAEVIEAATWNYTQNVMYLYTIPLLAANASAWTNVSTGVGAIGGCGLTISYQAFTQSGNLTSGANTVSGLQDTSLMAVGMTVSGTGIPVGTTIATIPSSTTLTLSANATGTSTVVISFYYLQYPEQIPMMIEAATDYTADNSVQNYMFQIFPGVTPSVTDNTTSDAYDSLSINYYGSTQTAGQIINFYQRGLLQGSSIPTNITDMNAYVNEIWFKDAASVAILNLLLGLGQVPANQQGRSQVLSVLQEVINQALTNGTISVGKTLSAAQKAFITNETSDNKAWYQVQNSGYWVDCVIVPIPDVLPIQYEADYTLIYSKDDVIRKVVGTQTLI